MSTVKRKIGADTWIYKSVSKGYRKRKDLRRHRKERAENGYSWFDWINADSFILGVIANMSKEFSDHGMGYPAGSSLEEWNATLASIYEPIFAYLDAEEAGDDATYAQSSAVELALKVFAEHHADFWD